MPTHVSFIGRENLDSPDRDCRVYRVCSRVRDRKIRVLRMIEDRERVL